MTDKKCLLKKDGLTCDSVTQLKGEFLHWHWFAIVVEAVCQYSGTTKQQQLNHSGFAKTLVLLSAASSHNLAIAYRLHFRP